MILAIQRFLNNLSKTMGSVIKIIFMSKLITKIKKSQQKKECIIMGNGPSFKESLNNNEEFFKNSDLVSVNFFPISNYFVQLKPKYLVITAPELWIDNVEQRFLDASEKLFTAINNNLNWSITLFMPAKARKFLRWKNYLNNENIRIKYYNVTPIEGFKFFNHYIFKKNLGMPRPHNVLIPSLMLMLNVGYKNIYLVGADHSWLPEITVDNNNNVLLNNKHFYDEGDTIAKPMNKMGKGKRRLHEVLLKLYYSFSSYFIINNYAITLKAKILNTTPGSFIDAFDRTDLENK